MFYSIPFSYKVSNYRILFMHQLQKRQATYKWPCDTLSSTSDFISFSKHITNWVNAILRKLLV